METRKNMSVGGQRWLASKSRAAVRTRQHPERGGGERGVPMAGRAFDELLALVVEWVV